jgi:quinol monooxygenase YgiN
MIHSTIRMQVSPQKHVEALRILRSTAERNKILPGCLHCRIYEDVQEDNLIMFEEIWTDEEAMERHLRSAEYRTVLLVMEMALHEPEVRFNTISRSTGIETIERAQESTSRGEWP